MNEEDEESRYRGERFKEGKRGRRKKETRRGPNRLEISRLLPARRSACKSRLFVLTLETRKKEKKRGGRGNKKNHHFHSSRRNIGRHRRRQNNSHYPSFEVNRLRGNFIRCQKAQRNHPRCTRLQKRLVLEFTLCMNRLIERRSRIGSNRFAIRIYNLSSLRFVDSSISYQIQIIWMTTVSIP